MITMIMEIAFAPPTRRQEATSSRNKQSPQKGTSFENEVDPRVGRIKLDPEFSWLFTRNFKQEVLKKKKTRQVNLGGRKQHPAKEGRLESSTATKEREREAPPKGPN